MRAQRGACGTLGFNPRPPRKVGATPFKRSSTTDGGATMVSILAHPERWALQWPMRSHGDVRRFPDGSFNPRPPRKVARYHCSRQAALRPETHVSILAHPERWALPRRGPRHTQGHGVSILAHPERWALLCVKCSCGTIVTVEFQILAHPERWALLHAVPVHVPRFDVSILAHPERWALGERYVGQDASTGILGPPRKVLPGLLYPGFNPRPPRKVGATCYCPFLSAASRKDKGMSKRHCGKLMFQSSPTPKGGRYEVSPDYPGNGSWRRFQSSPTPKGGRYVAGDRQSRVRGIRMFQSSPTPKGGRYLSVRVGRVAPKRGFNPRPPRKVGATVTQGVGETWFQVVPRRFNPRPPRKVGATTLGPLTMIEV